MQENGSNPTHFTVSRQAFTTLQFCFCFEYPVDKMLGITKEHQKKI